MSEDKKTMELKKREKLRSEGNESEKLLNEFAILLLSIDNTEAVCDQLCGHTNLIMEIFVGLDVTTNKANGGKFMTTPKLLIENINKRIPELQDYLGRIIPENLDPKEALKLSAKMRSLELFLEALEKADADLQSHKGDEVSLRLSQCNYKRKRNGGNENENF